MLKFPAWICHILKWYETDTIVAHNLLAASEADTLNMGIEPIMKRSSWNIEDDNYYVQYWPNEFQI